MQNSLWDKLFINAHLATFTGKNHGIIKNAALATYQNKIAWLGATKDLPKNKAREVIDCEQQWLLPGFIDCHTHLIYAGNRANEFSLRLQGKSYTEIAKAGGGILATVKATRQASFEQLYHQSAKRLQAFMNEGVTTVEIKSGYGLDLETEIKILRVAKQLAIDFPINIKTTYLGAHAIPPEYSQKADAYIDFICEEILPYIKQQNLADFVDGFCETIAFSPQQITKLFEKAKMLKLPVKLHAEQLSDQNSVYLAAKYHAVSADHLEYVNEKSIIAMQQAGTVAVLLPGAFYYLSETQKPPIDLLRKYQIPISISTDCNPGSSPTTSLLLMLNMACVIFRLTPEEALTGVTINAAKALNMEKTHGSLSVGKIADLVLWDIDHPQDLTYTMGFNFAKKIFKVP